MPREVETDGHKKQFVAGIMGTNWQYKKKQNDLKKYVL